MHTDVFVIGGGPAGLAAAIAARRKGMSVVVADCDRPPIDKACGEGLMPDAIAALSALGVHVDSRDGFPFRGIRFISGAHSVASSFPKDTALGVRRTTLHRIMIEHAEQAGVDLRWGVHVTRISADGVSTGQNFTPCRWIVGADGGNSRVRVWAGLDDARRDSRRFAFRRHYQIPHWSDCMEIYWGHKFQIYVTPVGSEEVCVVLMSRNPHLRLDEALPKIPAIANRLENAVAVRSERGAVSASRHLRSVYAGNVALIGDASGSVDAITGEGLCLSFRQSAILADALAAGDLQPYQAAHPRLARRPARMAELMLSLDLNTPLRNRAIRALSAAPGIFAKMLAMHVGELSPLDFAGSGMALAWKMLSV